MIPQNLNFFLAGQNFLKKCLPFLLLPFKATWRVILADILTKVNYHWNSTLTTDENSPLNYMIHFNWKLSEKSGKLLVLR